MKPSKFSDNVNAQAAFWDCENAQYVAAAGASTAFAADTIVFVAPTTSGAWITVGTAPTAAADTAGNSFVPIGQIAVLAVDSGDKIATTQPISITPVK